MKTEVRLGKKWEGGMRRRKAVLFLWRQSWISLRPWGGDALAEAAAATARGGALVPVQGSMGWWHGQPTWFLPASLPWPVKCHLSLHGFQRQLKENGNGIYLNEGGDGEGCEIRRRFCSWPIRHHVLGYFTLRSKRWGNDLLIYFLPVWFQTVSNNVESNEVKTLSLSRASLRFWSRAVCSSSCTPALTARGKRGFRKTKLVWKREPESSIVTCCLPSDIHHFNISAQLEQGCQELVGPAVDSGVGSTWRRGAVFGHLRELGRTERR